MNVYYRKIEVNNGNKRFSSLKFILCFFSIIFLIPSFLAFLYLDISSFRLYVSEKHLIKEYQKITGIIYDNNCYSNYCYPIYKYEVNGNEYFVQEKQRVVLSNINEIAIIWYNPNKVDEAVICSEKIYLTLFYTFILIIIFVPIFISIKYFKNSNIIVKNKTEF